VATPKPKAYFLKPSTLFQPETLRVDGVDYQKTWHGSYDLGDALKRNPEAAQLAELHKRSMNRGGLYLWTGLGLALGYLAVQGRRYDPLVYWGLFGTGLGLSLYEQHKGRDALQKAITLYNKEF